MKDTNDYVARVEPSEAGGQKTLGLLARPLKDCMVPKRDCGPYTLFGTNYSRTSCSIRLR